MKIWLCVLILGWTVAGWASDNDEGPGSTTRSLGPGALEHRQWDQDGRLVSQRFEYRRDQAGTFTDDGDLWLEVRVNRRTPDRRQVDIRYPRDNEAWQVRRQEGELTGFRHTRDHRIQGRLISGDQDNRIRETEYRDGTPHGPVRAIDENGDLVEEGTYRDGKRHGRFRYQGNDDIWEITGYRHGQKHGEWRRETGEGDVIERGEYHHDTPSGEWLRPLPGGLREISRFNDQGQLHGVQAIRSAGGLLRQHHEYRAGTRVGEWRDYDAEGQLTARRRYQDGQRQGEAFSTTSEGHKEWVHYRNDQMHGEYRRVSPAGYPLETGQFRKGQRQGRFLQYSDQGQVISITPYRDGVREGDGYRLGDGGRLRPVEWQQDYWLDEDGEKRFW